MTMKENSLTYKSQIYSDNGRSRLLHWKYATFHGPYMPWNQYKILPIQYRGSNIPLSLTRQCILIYINLFYTSVLVVLIPPQNMFKMFPQISGLEISLFSKADIGILQSPLKIFHLIYTGGDEV